MLTVPYQFLAFCNEWAQFMEQGDGFVSHIPVAVDGSCNGLQLYSLMLKDEKAGRLVNLTVTDSPQDIYQVIADNVAGEAEARSNRRQALGASMAQLWCQKVNH